jgi:heterodisulfide reductase subunit B
MQNAYDPHRATRCFQEERAMETASVNGKKCICGGHLVVQSAPDEIIIKARVLRVDVSLNCVHAKCSRCKRWVKVPLRFIFT